MSPTNCATLPATSSATSTSSTNSPSLQPAYQLACDALANEAAERGMGLDFITAEADPNERSTAIGNES